MAITKHQFKRLEIIDELLRQKFTQQEILRIINDKFSDYGKTITKRTFFRDINYLIDEKNAPIHRPESGDPYYYYTAKFSIKNVPIDEDDVAVLKRAATVLKQVDNFKMMEEVEAVIQKLENKIHSSLDDLPAVIQFEKHTTSSGREHLENIMDAIESRNAIKIKYQPFTYKEAIEKVVHPYLLKEFRNRWFLIGRPASDDRVDNFALDRIKKIKNTNDDFIDNDLFDPDHYFDYLIGVSIPRGAQPEEIEIKIFKDMVPYIESKPVHHLQSPLKRNKDGSAIAHLNLIINYELKSVLLGYGSGIEVRKPKSLRQEMKELLKETISRYK